MILIIIIKIVDAEDGFQICLKKLRKKNKYFWEICFIYNNLEYTIKQL